MSAGRRPTVLITGCTTGGIGHSLALEFHRRGCRVFATTRNPSTMQDLVEHEGVETLVLDVCKPESIAAAREQIERLTGGKLDYLVNNAGGLDVAQPALELDEEAAKAIFDLNFFAVARMVRAFTPLLINSGNGHIVNIGSVIGVMPTAFMAMYGAARAAMHAYADALRIELAPIRIQVTTIVTGLIQNSKPNFSIKLAPESLYRSIEDTWLAMTRRTNADPMPPQIYAKDVVNEVLKSKPRWTFWYGKSTTTVWFVATFLPKRLVARMFAKMYGLDKLALGFR